MDAGRELTSAGVEAEILRLAPWYYHLDLAGVSTDIGPPCDRYGFRKVFCPPIQPGFWAGKTVLDVACNEGAYGFGALDLGAASLTAFDCRGINIEKARLVAAVRDYRDVKLSVDDCDSWLASHPGARFDVVMLCGILYHLPDPARTIAEFCRVAQGHVYVSSLLRGGADGYTLRSEPESIAASFEHEDSCIPNTTNTLIAEFRKYAFHPIHVEESRRGIFWGGCNLVLAGCAALPEFRLGDPEGDAAELDLFLVPRAIEDAAGRREPFDLDVVFYNRSMRARSVRAQLNVRGSGAIAFASDPVIRELPPRVAHYDDPSSQSLREVVKLDLGTCEGDATIEVIVRDLGTGSELRRRLTLRR